MLSKMRKRVTYANVAMTLALVFAMTGGAYAAKKYLIASTKQISPKVLKQLEGKAGPAGAQGPAGPTGPQGVKGENGLQGEKGIQGEKGATGATGKSGVTGNAGVAECKEGGATIEIEGTPSSKKHICNGEKGPEGVCSTSSCHLPTGVTETGELSANAVAPLAAVLGGKYLALPISFAVPLEKSHEGAAHIIGQGGTPTTECPGSALEPRATSGNLCVYLALVGNVELSESFIINHEATLEAIDTAGAVLALHPKPTQETEPVFVVATWAVTG